MQSSCHLLNNNYETFINQLPIAALVVKSNGVICLANSAAKELYGLPLEKIIGTQVSFQLLPGEVIEEALHIHDDVQIIVEINTVAFDWQGEEAYLVNLHDVTSYKIIVDRESEQEKLFELMFLQALDGFFFMMLDEPVFWNSEVDKEAVLDYVFAHQRITKINDAMLLQYGASKDQFIGLTPTDFFEHDIESGRNVWRNFFDEGRLHVETGERRIDDGTPIWVEGDYICLYDEEGRITGHFGVQRDVSSRHKAEIALHQRDAILEAITLVAERFLMDIGWEEGMDETLAVLGKAVGAGKVAIIESHELGDEQRSVDERYIWKPDLSSMDQGGLDYKNLCLVDSPLKRWLLLLKQNEVVYGRVEDLPQGEAQYLEKQGVKSFVVVPIFVERHFWGVLSFEEFAGLRQWGDIEVDLLMTVAGLFSAAIQRRNAEESLANTNLELKKVIKQAKANARLAEEANQAKSDFLASMSHELRTPMNGVLGMASLLVDTNLTFEQNGYVEIIRKSGETLLTLLNDILDFSKINAGKLELEAHPVDLRDCVETALELVGAKAAKKKLDIGYLCDDSMPAVILGDGTRLKQILVNLLDNAVKFTEAGEVILNISTRMLAHRQCELTFSVKDTGIGIPEKSRQQLYKSFSQLHTSVTRKYGGTGLGLAISKRLVEIMGGEMWVESEGVVGKGTTFHFTVRFDVVKEQMEFDESMIPVEFRNKRVLILDDNETYRQFLRRFFEKWGMSITAVPSAGEAFSLMKEYQDQPFDLFLGDVWLLDEANALGEILQNQKDGNLPTIIFLTYLGLPAPVTFSGISSFFISKPVKYGSLFDVVERIFREGIVEQKRSSDQRKNVVLQDAVGIWKIAGEYPLRILMAEDNLVNQRVAQRMLNKLGYHVDMVSNGLEALEAVRQKSYDVVLMDIQMPELDGDEATKLIRSEISEDKQPYIVALTANAIVGDREKYLAIGMDDYISKPVRLEKLRDALMKCFGRITGKPLEYKGKKAIQPAISRDLLETFWSVVGQDVQEMLIGLIDEFMETSQKQMADLVVAVEVNDTAAIKRIVKKLTGYSLHFGVLRFTELCKKIEEVGSLGSYASAELILNQLQLEYQRVLGELQLLKEEIERQDGVLIKTLE